MDERLTFDEWKERVLVGNDQGTAILPDGTLWALAEGTAIYEGVAVRTYRLVPRSAEASDTDV